MLEGRLQTVILVWTIALSVAVVVILLFWRNKAQSDTDTRETLLFRLGQLEMRVRSLEDNGYAVGDELARLQMTQHDIQKQETPPVLEPVNVEPAPPSSPQISPQVAEILQRSQRGQSVLQIAKEMGLGQGEVQLILSLDNSVRDRR